MTNRNLLTALFLLGSIGMLQAAEPDFYRSTGKIYGAYAVALLLVLGLLAYLFYIDRKLTRIEKEFED